MNIAQLLAMCDVGHETLHTFEPDFDETVTVALTEHDVLLVSIGLAAINAFWKCLDEQNLDLQKRISEIISVQKPGWLRTLNDGA
jgi:hypothetical protein